MRRILTLAISIFFALFWAGSTCLAQSKKTADKSLTIVVLPFDSSAKGAGTLPEATRSVVIQMLKEGELFGAVITPEEAKDRE